MIRGALLGAGGQLSPRSSCYSPRPHNESFPAGRSAMKTSWLLWSLVPLSEDRGLHLPGPREKHHVRVRSQTCIWERCSILSHLLVCLQDYNKAVTILAFCPGISQFTLWSLLLPVCPIIHPFTHLSTFLPSIDLLSLDANTLPSSFPFIQPSLHLPVR